MRVRNIVATFNLNAASLMYLNFALQEFVDIYTRLFMVLIFGHIFCFGLILIFPYIISIGSQLSCHNSDVFENFKLIKFCCWHFHTLLIAQYRHMEWWYLIWIAVAIAVAIHLRWQCIWLDNLIRQTLIQYINYITKKFTYMKLQAWKLLSDTDLVSCSTHWVLRKHRLI